MDKDSLVDDIITELFDNGIVRIKETLDSKGNCNRIYNLVINKLYSDKVKFKAFNSDLSIVLSD